MTAGRSSPNRLVSLSLNLQAQHRKALASDDLMPGVKEISPSPGSSKSFDVTAVPGVLSLTVDVDFTTGDDWKASLKITPKVFGIDMGASAAELSSTNSSITMHPSVATAKADITLGFYGPDLCFGIKGNACYWAISWHCQDFDASDLFCLRR